MQFTRREPGMTRVFLTVCLVLLLQPCVPLLAAANSPPSQPAQNAPGFAPSSAIDLQRVEEAMRLIESNYHQKISRSALEEACLSGLMEPHPTSADPGAGRRAIAAALERALVSQPGNAVGRGSEQCLRGIASSLKRHSAYIDARGFRDMRGSGPKLAGIGLELVGAEQGARVVAPIEGTPAARAGLKKGDILTRIDGRELGGMPLDEVMHLLRGERHSTVRITLLDSTASEPRTIALERDFIQRESVNTRLIRPGLALVRITEFDIQAMQKLSDGLAELALTSGGPLRGIVLDLRASTGGLLPVTVGIAAAFLPEKALVMYTKGRTVDSSLTLLALPMFYVFPGQKSPYGRLPAETRTARMVVLVSETTAAGAEALAGALQDHKRAAIVGSNTAGVGVVRTILPLKGGDAFSIASASMFRPSGEALDGVGVIPDVSITERSGALPGLPTPGSPDPALEEALRILGMQ